MITIVAISAITETKAGFRQAIFEAIHEFLRLAMMPVMPIRIQGVRPSPLQQETIHGVPRFMGGSRKSLERKRHELS